MSDARGEDRWVGWVLAVALIAISSAAVLIRKASDAGAWPLTIAFWRTVGAALVLAPALRRLPPAARPSVLLGGVSLALHFGCWISSLTMTSVLRSTLLVTLAPAWAGLIEWRVLGKAPSRRFWIGIGVALLAAGAAADAGSSGRLQGDLLALAGGVFGAAYWFAGGRARQHADVAAYGAGVNLVAASLLWPSCLLIGAPLIDLSGEIWAWLIALVLVAQVLGHTGMAYALGSLRASTVSALTLLEPVGAAVLAWPLLGEPPGALDAAAGVLILGGVLVATWGGEPPPEPGSLP